MPNSRAIAQRRGPQSKGFGQAKARPPVGQMAVLNGQPVMWKGDRWGTPPSEAIGVPSGNNSNWQNRLNSRRSGTSPSTKGSNKSDPPVGQMAVLNGQPVMWKGPSGWGTPPSEAIGVPEAAPSQPGEGAAFQRQLQGRTAPAPVISSGNSQQRIVPGGSQPAAGPTPVTFSSIQPGTFNSTSDPSNPLGIDRDALARAAFGNEGFTNKMAIQAEDYSKVLANGLGGNANGFTLAGNLMGGQAPGAQPGSSNFAAAAGMNQLVNPVVDAESSIGLPGVVQASFNPAADLVPSGPGATVETTGQEQAAQDFANQAVSRAMETQNRMREIRGMPLLVE